MISADQTVGTRNNTVWEISTSTYCIVSVRVLIILIFLTASISCSTSEGYHEKIFFNQPACGWNEGIPIGNGNLGGMIYRGVETDIFKINEKTFCSGGPRDLQDNVAIKYLPRLRKLLLEDKTKEAEARIDPIFMA